MKFRYLKILSFLAFLSFISTPGFSKPKGKSEKISAILWIAKELRSYISFSSSSPSPSSSSSSSSINSLYLRSREEASLLFHHSDLNWIADHVPELHEEIISSRAHSSRSTHDTIDLPRRSYVLLQLITFISRNFEAGMEDLISNLPHLTYESLVQEIRSLNSPTLNQHFVSAIRKLYKQNSSSRDSLETRYADEWFQYVDINETFDFYRDCRVPNEIHPEKIYEHLHDTMIDKGVLVSVGSERGFFALTQSPDRITGLVGRDLNPKIIAYMHFNTLLLKISKTREDYLELSSSKISNSRLYLEKIIMRLYTSPMDLYLKKFYIFHLHDFAEAYFSIPEKQQWKKNVQGHFDAVAYHRQDNLFYKLQRYAREGDIIFTKGDINELEFIDEDLVSVIDTSNIWAYAFLNFNLAKRTIMPRILWTFLPTKENPYVSYISYEHYRFNEEENKEEFEDLMNKILDAMSLWSNNPIDALTVFEFKEPDERLDSLPITAVSLQTLSRLRSLVEKIDELPGFGPFIKDEGSLHLINHAKSKILNRFIKALLSSNDESENIKDILRPYSSHLRPDFVMRVFQEL